MPDRPSSLPSSTAHRRRGPATLAALLLSLLVTPVLLLAGPAPSASASTIICLPGISCCPPGDGCTPMPVKPPAPDVCATAGYSTNPMAPEPVTANEDEPGVITVTVTRPTCSGDAPSAWFYVFDNYGGGHQYHIVDNGQAEQACQIPLLHAFQPGDLDDVVHAYAVNRNGHSSATADSNPFVFTGPVAGTSAPITNPCIG